MLLSMSAVVLLGLLIWFLLHIRYFKWLDVLLCGVFGFLLAKTAASSAIYAALLAISGFLGQLRF
ncbi:hypothetical protein GCM10009801_22940 [Streptomyces albiaxialis]|uniref:Uncharacterized protein n=1 Tax=Streptomyces albiaxialis TaxID=329523 RepID=A0ABP5HEX7_9ACTN